MRHLISTLILLCLTSFCLLAQESPVKYTWEAESLGGNEFKITFKAKIQDGWYTYSQYLASEDGPVATSVNFESNNETKNGKSTEKASKSAYKIAGYDDIFKMDVTKYKKDLTIVQKITVKDLNKPVTGYLTYMTCDATRCMPPTDVEFTFDPAKLVAAATPDKKPEDPANNTASTDTEEKPVQAEEKPTETEEPAPTPSADSDNPVTWVIQFNKVSENEVDLVAKASIAEGWYVYSQTLESDEGPVATNINFEGDAVVEEVSNVETVSEPAYKLQMMDKVFNMQLTKYKHDFTITQRIKVEDPNVPVTGYLNYMTCDATKCMPPTDVEFTYSFMEVIEEPIPGSYNGTTSGDTFNPIRPKLIASMSALEGDTDIAGVSLWTIFMLGFGGGLLALLTPCVFPMIPMTVSLFSKGKKKSKSESIKNALIFGASIIVIYVSLGLIITLSFGPEALNLLSTHWFMNLTFFALFTIFAFSFFGYFDISLPSSWANKADQASMKGGLIGTFFGAFSIALVSFSCTGPIIGTLLVTTVNGGVVGPSVGMLGFSVALALPFTLFAAFPSWLQSLPNSGGWMTSMKVILGFLELALGLKFLSTADLTEHWGILPYELFVGLWAVIFLGMTLYLFGFIHFPHDNPKAKISIQRKALGAFAGVLTLSILSGFMTNPQTEAFKTPFWLSGLAPSACYSYIKPCPTPKVANNIDSQFKLSEHCPPGINQCFDDYDEALKYAATVNKPILIDFTGHGCVNCRKMEENVWIDEEINKMLNEDYVLVSLYADDRKKLAKTLITPGGVKLRNVGNKWAEFQKVNFKKNSQPYYVLITTDEKVLNTPKPYTPDISTYKDFLVEGLEEFKKSSK